MRLAVIAGQESPVAGSGELSENGTVRRIAELSQALVTAGHEVRVYARADGRHPPGTGWLPQRIPVEYLPAGPARRMSEATLLRHTRLFGDRLAAAWSEDGWRPQLVHAHYWLSGLAALVATRTVAVPVALTYHEIGVARRRHLGSADPSPDCRVGLERELGRAVGRVIAQSRAEIAELTWLGVPRDRMALVPAGVDIDSFAPDTPLAPGPASPRRILAVGSAGRLAERKGFADLIRAMPLVPDAQLLVVGGPAPGELARDQAVRRLRAAAAGCGVADRVQFVGRVPRDEMPRWYRSADVVVCGSWHEPAGACALEAMAAGVPVVATAVGGLRDVVVDGVTGVLVPPHRPATLGRAIRAVLASPITRMEYAAAGLDRVRQIYAWDRVASRLAHQYRSLTPAGSI